MFGCGYAGLCHEQGRGDRVGVLADRGGAPAPAAPGWPYDRTGLRGRSPADAGGAEHRPVSSHRSRPFVVPSRRRALQCNDRRVDAPPTAPLRADPRCRGRDQHADPACPLPARLRALPGTVRDLAQRPSLATLPSMTQPVDDTNGAARAIDSPQSDPLHPVSGGLRTKCSIARVYARLSSVACRTYDLCQWPALGQPHSLMA